MNPTPILGKALQELDKAMQGTLDGTKISAIKETIRGFAIAAAIASAVAGLAPGIAGVVAILTQTGFVWATYVKINNTLGISMTKNTAKFLGSAIVTNIILNAGAFIGTLIASGLLSFIPGLGSAASAALNAAMGYVLIYAAAIIYLKLITHFIHPDGTLNISENDSTKETIKDIVSQANIRDIIKEGRESYKEAKKDGSIDRAKAEPKCPNCGADTAPGQKFCSNCGTQLG